MRSLVVNGRRNQCVADLERECAFDDQLVVGVRHGRDDGSETGPRKRIDAVDPAAITAIPDAEPIAEFILNDRAAERDAVLITQTAAYRRPQLRSRETAELG